jgi:PAS domain S-box-containing protein
MSDLVIGHLPLANASKRTSEWRPARIAAGALILCIGYYIGARVGFAVTFSPHPISTLWPPNAILLAALLLAPTRWWWALLLAALPAHIAVELNSGVPIGLIFCWFVSNSVEALLGAALIRRFSGEKVRFDALQNVSVFTAFAVFVAPIASSFLDAGFVKLIGWGTDSYWQIWLMRTLSNVLAALTIIPVILITADRGLRILTKASPWRLVEGLVLAIGLFSVGLIAFTARGPHLGTVPALVYAPLPFMLWTAVRFGPGALSTSLLATVFMVIWGCINGRGPFTGISALENVISMQVFMVLMAVPLMFLSAVITERHKTAQALRESESRYRSVVETQTELVCRYKEDTTLTFVNDAYCRYFDKPREEFLGAKVLNLTPRDSREAVKSHIESLFRNPREEIFEHKVLLTGGNIGWLHWVSKPILGDDGQLIEFQGVGRDITEQHRAEDELKQSEDRWRLIFDNSAVGIVVTDVDGRYFATNAVYERMLGYSKQELTDLTLFDVTEEDHLQPSRALITELLTGKRSQFQIDARCRQKGGQQIWVTESVSTVHDSQGKPVYLIAIVEDVTERRRTSDALNKLNIELEQRVADRTAALDLKTRELEAFTYSVAHDLKAPLRGIEGYTSLLLEDYLNRLDAEGRSLLLNVHSSAEQMTRLIDDLLAYSRIDYATLALQHVELRSFIMNLVERRKRTLDNDHITFRINAAYGSALVDPAALEQALRNYLDNAIKFSRTIASPCIEVGSNRCESGCGWLLWVRDNGVGFDMKHAGDVFEIFRRLHHDEEYEGTGVGLAIVRKVIERMGGRVWAESEPTRGSTFFLEFPD